MSEWVDWLRWGAPELARRVNALDASPVRRGGGPVHAGFGAASPARDAVIALQQDACRTVREREALHRGALKAGLPRLGLAAGCDFLAATAAAVEAADFETLWDTGRAVTRLLTRCDQVEGLAEPVRVIRGLEGRRRARRAPMVLPCSMACTRRACAAVSGGCRWFPYSRRHNGHVTPPGRVRPPP